MKKKLILILIPLLLLTAGGGAAAWWFFLKDPEMEIDLAEMAGAEDPLPIFKEFDPLVLPVIRDGKVTKHLTFTIILEIDPASEQTEIYTYRRRLIDAYTAQLHALYSHRFVQDRDDPIPLISKRLLAVSRRLLGAKTQVNRVLVSVLDKADLLQG